uniref:G-protein coupled receptors family 1 profile domain-containing protein n=1 Tax=Nothobranchius furzeri TaxID=105023 RepID=A0A8C6Q582_NOTFU
MHYHCLSNSVGLLVILLVFLDCFLLTKICSSANTITSLIIWRRKCMISVSSSFYLMAISVADNLTLISIVVLELSLKYHQQEPFWSHEPWCNLREVFNYGAYNASTWLVVLFTVERYISIQTWKIRRTICSPRCVVWTIVIVFIFSHLSAIPFYRSNASVQENNHTLCIYKPEAPTQFIHTLVWFQTLPLLPITQIILRTTKMYTLDRNDYNSEINIVADIGTMLCLSNAAINMYLYVCTQSRFRQEFLACLKQVTFYCKNTSLVSITLAPSHCFSTLQSTTE